MKKFKEIEKITEVINFENSFVKIEINPQIDIVKIEDKASNNIAYRRFKLYECKLLKELKKELSEKNINKYLQTVKKEVLKISDILILSRGIII